MSTKFRKFVSVLLACVMVFSLCGLTAFAATDTSDANSGTVVHNGGEQTAENGNVKIQKTAIKTDKNTFDITLKVTTTDDVQTTTKSNPAHVVMVIDRSGSMGGSRITNAKSAANQFADSFFGNNASADNKLAVVSFAGTATTDIGLSSKAQKSSVTDAINKLSASGGTNTQGAIHTACSILTCGHKASVKDIIVLLSDGEPTYSYQLTGTATWTGCDSGWFGHSWDDGWFGDGKTDSGSIKVTGCNYDNNNLLGCGSDYSVTDSYGYNYVDNLSVTSTCTHGKTRTDSVRYDSTGIVNIANNGYATIWEANQAKGSAEIYSILLMSNGDKSYNNASHVMSNVASDAAHYKSTADATSLGSLFTDISDSLTTPTDAGIVTDPMGPKISFVGVKGDTNNAASFDNKTNTLTWDSSKTTATTNADKSKTRTLTYTVTLNTSVESFDENTTYATNETTTFKYKIGATEKPLDFDVPTVRGIIPSVAYTVKYWKQEDAVKGDYTNYTLADTSKEYTGKLNTTVSLADIDTGYSSKYERDYYSVAKADTSLKLTADANLCLNVYYNRDTVKVTVNHYLTTTTINKDGSKTIDTEPKLLPSESISDSINKGSDYEAAKLTSYTFDHATPGTTVKNVTSDTAINLYYITTVDTREKTALNVYYQYDNYKWDLNKDGIYEKVLVEGTPELKNTYTDYRTLDAFEMAINTTDADGYTYKSVEAKNGSTAINCSANSDTTLGKTTIHVDKLGANENTVTITFVQDLTTPPAQDATIKVTHHYTKNVKTIVDGTVVTDTIAPADIIETLPASGSEKYYVHETRTVTANKTQPNGTDTYEVVGDASHTFNDLMASNEITFNYKLESAPSTTTATVNHIYRSFEQYTDDGGTTKTREVDSARIEKAVPVKGLYVGQHIPVTLNPDALDGYTLNGTDSTENYAAVPAQANGATAITLYYDKNAIDDSRDDASVTVTHTYYTNLTTVENGKVVTKENQLAGTEDSDTLIGKVGDIYTATPKTAHSGSSDWTLKDSEALTGTYKKGTNKTIALAYERNASDLAVASYVANYYYYDWQMSVKDGLAGYYDGDSKTQVDKSEGTKQTSYQGVRVELPSGERDGYELSPVISTTQTLEAEENVYNFIYVKKLPLSEATVNVQHKYTLTNIDAVGKKTFETSENSGSVTPVTLHEGETVTAPAAYNGGYTLDSVTVTDANNKSVTYTLKDDKSAITFTAPTGTTAVVFNYSKAGIDESVPVNFQIENYYRTLDWNDSSSKAYEIDPSKTTSGSSYATLTVSCPAKPGDYTLDADKTVVEGGTLADDTLTLVKDGDNTNIVKYYYTKTVDTRVETKVKVEHNYYTYDTYTSKINAAPEKMVVEYVTGKDKCYVGGSYTAAPVYTYKIGDTAYTANGYDAIHPNTPANLTIDPLKAYVAATADAAEQIDTITINYVRNISSAPVIGPVGPVGPVIPDDDTPKNDKPSTSPSASPSTSPSTPTSSDATIPDDDVPQNDKPGDANIPDDETPTADKPVSKNTSTIPDDKTPLGGSPKTGDNSSIALFSILAAASAAGLAAIGITGKKKKHEDK